MARYVGARAIDCARGAQRGVDRRRRCASRPRGRSCVAAPPHRTHVGGRR